MATADANNCTAINIALGRRTSHRT